MEPLVNKAFDALSDKNFGFSDVQHFLCQQHGMDAHRDWTDVETVMLGSLKSGALELDGEGKYTVAARRKRRSGKRRSPKRRSGGSRRRRSSRRSRRSRKKGSDDEK